MRSPGVVLDVSGGRTLYVATTGTTATLRLHDNADAADVAISSVPTPAGYVQTSFFGNARLTPFGCIYSTGDWGSYRLQEYRGGAALDLGIALDFLIDATGRYALIQRGSSDIILRDLTSGTDVFVFQILAQNMRSAQTGTWSISEVNGVTSIGSGAGSRRRSQRTRQASPLTGSPEPTAP